MNPQQPTPPLPNSSPIADLPQEQLLFELKRHPIGIIGLYIGSALMLLVLAVVAFGLAPKYITSVSSGQVYAIASVAFFIFMFLVLGFVYIAHIVYWSNIWQLSAESLTQINRTSLFDKQASHLSLGNLQDVTAEQDGILPHLLKYGSLRVETAGERSKFIFPFCPNPNYYAQQILTARERFEQGRVVNNGVNTPYASVPTYQPPTAEVPQYPTPPTGVEPPTYPLPPAPPVEPQTQSTTVPPQPQAYDSQPPYQA